MSMEELVTIYTVSNAIEAEIIKNALDDEGYHCEIEGGHQAGDAGLIGIEIKLQVPANEAAEARAFVLEHAQSHEDDEDDDDDEPDEDTSEAIEAV